MKCPATRDDWLRTRPIPSRSSGSSTPSTCDRSSAGWPRCPTLAVETGDGGTVTALAKTAAAPGRLVPRHRRLADRAGRLRRCARAPRAPRRGHLEGHAPGRGQRPAPAARGDRGPARRPASPASAPTARWAVACTPSPAPARCARCSRCAPRRRPFALRVGGVDVAEVALDDTVIVVGSGQRPMQLRRVEVEVQPEWVEALEPIVRAAARRLRAAAGHACPSSRRACSPSALDDPRAARPRADRDHADLDHGRARLRRAAAPVRRAARQGARDPPGRGPRGTARHAGGHPSPARRPRCSSPTSCPVRAAGLPRELGWLAADPRGGARPRRAARGDGRHGRRDRRLERTSSAPTGRPARPTSPSCSPASARPPGPTCSTPSTRSAGSAWPRASPPWSSRAPRAARPPPGPGRHRPCPSWSWPATTPWRRRPSGPSGRAWSRDFHRLRIRCKRLRYSLEFSAELYGGRTSRYVRAAHRAPGRARPHAGRRGGLPPAWPTWPPVRTPPAGRDRLRHGRRGRALPPRRRPLLRRLPGSVAGSAAGVARAASGSWTGARPRRRPHSRPVRRTAPRRAPPRRRRSRRRRRRAPGPGRRGRHPAALAPGGRRPGRRPSGSPPCRPPSGQGE